MQTITGMDPLPIWMPRRKARRSSIPLQKHLYQRDINPKSVAMRSKDISSPIRIRPKQSISAVRRYGKIMTIRMVHDQTVSRFV